jgi:hypothetical protein
MGKLNKSGRWSKLDVALNANLVLAGPINAMGIRAFDIIADPVCFYGSGIKFRARSRMDPHFLFPLRNVGKRWFVTEKFLERGTVAKSLDRGLVFQLNGIMNGFRPEIFGEISGMEHGADVL